MQAKLFVLSGPLKGSIIGLEDGITRVGRDASSRVYIDDEHLSRLHCEFERHGDRVAVRDMKSLNGVFVNGVPVKERTLESGDQIQIGDSIIFYSPDAYGDDTSRFERTRDRLLAELTTVQRPIEALAGITRTAPEHAAALGERSTSWLTFSAAAVSTRQTDALKMRLLESLTDLLRADRGALVPSETRPDFGPAITSDKGALWPIDAALVQKAMRDRQAATAGISEDAQRRWALCAPLLGPDTIGVVYVTRANATFAQWEVELASVAAGLAAMAMENVRQAERLERDIARLSDDLNRDRTLVGESEPMKDVIRLITRAAPNDSTVLILGESGTGKELAARAIHARSHRARRPFSAINCASLNDALLESHLFGHERGAFTGAVALKRGLFEAADGGTVFLDEVGEIPLNLQARLLRVLQEREFERVGGTRRIKVDVRIVAATNRPLKKAVTAGTFREDLYFRLRVIEITMPPLRERRDDIGLLARYFVQKHAQRCGRRVSGIASPALDALVGHDWPGNVRELENAIERAIALGRAGEVLLEDLPEDVIEGSPTEIQSALRASLRSTKVETIRKSLEQAHGSYAATARILGIHVNALHRMIRTLGILEEVREIRARLKLSETDD